MSRTRRKNNSIVGQFVAHSREMRESPAWAAVPDNARRVLDRLELEHMRHGGAENGSLPCTYSDFVAHGVRRASVSLALRQCEALGFLEITHRGGRSISEYRDPSRYRLTYLNGRGQSAIKTDEWKRIETDEDAKAALKRAAEEKNRSTQACRAKNAKTPDALAYPAPDALAELGMAPSRTRKRNSCTRRESGTPIYISGRCRA
jgi:hypothetical protein